MASGSKKIRKPSKTASFKEYMEYYMNKKGWSQSKLSVCARLNQSHVNKIINGRITNIAIDTLVCLCLALQLNVAESKDLLSRAERAFSPASELHEAYQKLIAIYVFKVFEVEDEQMLDYADQYLEKRDFPTLPNVNSG